jgi:hypothetical protein
LPSSRDETFKTFSSSSSLNGAVSNYYFLCWHWIAGSRWFHFHFAESIFGKRTADLFALFFIAIAGFYLAFTAYFGDQGAWRLETGAVILFAVFGILGLRLPVALIIGYSLHGVWDVVHEIHAHCGVSPAGAQEMTELPLAYGAFCAAFDLCIVTYV